MTKDDMVELLTIYEAGINSSLPSDVLFYDSTNRFMAYLTGSSL
jgi:hypothetical protein